MDLWSKNLRSKNLRSENLQSKLKDPISVYNRRSGGRAQVQQQAVGQELARLWAGAMIFAPHLAGCACAGGFHVPLEPGAVEQDILEFLHYRYRQDGRTALAQFVADRLAQVGPKAGPEAGQSDFGTWLAHLDEAPVGSADLKQLAADIRTPLESMSNAAPAAGGGFVCY